MWPPAPYDRHMSRPVIGITTSTRSLDTITGLGERHHTIGDEYLEAVRLAGGVPVALPTFDPPAAAEVVARLDGLLLSGGNDIEPIRYGASADGSLSPDRPRDSWELTLADAAWDAALPILGICRGAQLLNVSRGGTLIQDIWGESDDHRVLARDGQAVQDEGEHEIEIGPATALFEVYGTSSRIVNTLHHQALDRIGTGLVVSARATDGTVEAVESEDGSAIGVQWHPERMDPREETVLFASFVARAARFGAL